MQQQLNLPGKARWRLEQNPDQHTITVSLEFFEPAKRGERFSRTIRFASKTIRTRWRTSRGIVGAVRNAQFKLRDEAERAWSKYLLLNELLGHLDGASLWRLADPNESSKVPPKTADK